MKATKLPSGKWRARAFSHVDANGKKVYKSFTADTKAEAEHLASKFKFDRKEPAKNHLTVGQIIDKYIDEFGSVMSPSTVVGYLKNRRNYLQSLMDIPVDKLTESVVQRAVNTDSRRYSPKTVHNAYGLFTASMRAYNNDPGFKIVLPQKKPSKIKIPTDDEIKQLVWYGRDPQLKASIVLAALLGLRRSEICALNRTDVDLATLSVTIDKAMVIDKNKEWQIKPPKTEAGTRTIKTDEKTLAHILEVPNTGPRLFEWTPCQLSHHYDRAKKKLGITCRLHDLRHYNASIMLALNVPDKYAMQRMGHSTPNMLKKVYQHTIESKETEVAVAMSDYFDKIHEI